MVWGSLISAGAKLAGGALDFFGSERNRSAVLSNAREDRALQREFAQHGIRWRVKDAQAAGIHPLYAIGGAGATYSPSAISLPAGGNLGRGLADAGQDIGRAIDSTRTKKERHDARAGDIARLSVERGQLENELLRTQISRLKAEHVGPPMVDNLPSAMPGQGDFDDLGYSVKRVEVPAVQTGNRNQEAGAFPETRWARTATGWQPVPSREAFEDADIANPAAFSWYWRNQIKPTLMVSGDPPPDSFLPKGAFGWIWSPGDQEWRPQMRPPDVWDRHTYFKPRRRSRNAKKIPVTPPRAGGW